MEANKPTYEELEKKVKVLENQLELYNKFMEISPFYIFFKDKDLKTLTLSRNFEHLTGIPVEEMIGKTDEALFIPDYAREMIEVDKKVLSENKTIQKYTTYNGKIYSSEMFPAKLNDNSAVILGYAMDVTKFIKTEKALKESEQNLIQKNQEYLSINEEYLALNEELKIINELLYLSKKELEEKEEQLREIFDNSMDYIFVIEVKPADKFLIKKVNKARVRLFNINKTDIEGKYIDEFLDEKSASPLILKYKQCVETKKSMQYEEYVDFQSDKFYYSTNIVPLLDENSNVIRLIGVSRDITIRKKAEIALHESEEKYRLLFDNAGDSIFIHDEMGNILAANKTAINNYGYSSEEMLSLKAYDIDTPDESTKTNDRISRLMMDGDITFETMHRRKDNSTLIVEVIARKIIYDGKDAVLSICHDITRRKHAESVINEQNAELLKLNKDKDLFISILSHDLKGSLGAMLNLSELLKKDIEKDNTKNIKKFIVPIFETSQNTYALLINILDWARIQQGTIPFNPQLIEVNALILKSIDSVKSMAKLKEISIHYKEEENISIFADMEMLKIIIRNLLTNAIKFTQEKGFVLIAANLIDHEIVVSIKDNGVGMNEDVKNSLFKIGNVVSAKGTSGESGTGLGLILCKEFIEKHGGKIRVESEAGLGSNFTFTLPLKTK